jgi:hypothetical protein
MIKNKGINHNFWMSILGVTLCTSPLISNAENYKHTISTYTSFLNKIGDNKKSSLRLLGINYQYAISSKLKIFSFIAGLDNKFKAKTTTSNIDSYNFGGGAQYQIARGTTIKGSMFYNTKNSKITYTNSAINNYSMNGKGVGVNTTIYQILPLNYTTFFVVSTGVTAFKSRNNAKNKNSNNKIFSQLMVGLSLNHKMSEKLWGSISIKSLNANKPFTMSKRKNLQKMGLGGVYIISEQWKMLANYSHEMGKKHHGDGVVFALSKSF